MSNGLVAQIAGRCATLHSYVKNREAALCRSLCIVDNATVISSCVVVEPHWMGRNWGLRTLEDPNA